MLIAKFRLTNSASATQDLRSLMILYEQITAVLILRCG